MSHSEIIEARQGKPRVRFAVPPAINLLSPSSVSTVCSFTTAGEELMDYGYSSDETAVDIAVTSSSGPVAVEREVVITTLRRLLDDGSYLIACKLIDADSDLLQRCHAVIVDAKQQPDPHKIEAELAKAMAFLVRQERGEVILQHLLELKAHLRGDFEPTQRLEHDRRTPSPAAEDFEEDEAASDGEEHPEIPPRPQSRAERPIRRNTPTSQAPAIATIAEEDDVRDGRPPASESSCSSVWASDDEDGGPVDGSHLSPETWAQFRQAFAEHGRVTATAMPSITEEPLHGDGEVEVSRAKEVAPMKEDGGEDQEEMPKVSKWRSWWRFCWRADGFYH